MLMGVCMRLRLSCYGRAFVGIHIRCVGFCIVYLNLSVFSGPQITNKQA